MTDTQAKLMHSRIWDLLSDYADIREELVEALSNIRSLYEELEIALYDLSDDLDEIEDHLSATGRSLRKYRGPDPVCLLPWEEPGHKEEVLPWN